MTSALHDQVNVSDSVTIATLDPDDLSHIALLIEAAQDQVIVDSCYLPAGLAATSARAWAAAQESAWVILEGGTPVGVASLHPVEELEGVKFPAGSVEIEDWVLAPNRGRRLVPTAWILIEQQLPANITSLNAVVWESNNPSNRRFARDGWTYLGRCWWSDETSNGWCLAWNKRRDQT